MPCPPRHISLWLLLRLIVVAFGGFALAGVWADPPAAPKPSPDHRILIVASYHFSHLWSQDIIRAIRHKLITDLDGCIIDYIELNAVRNSPEEIEERFHAYLPNIKAGKYHAVVAILDDAITLLQQHHDVIPPSLPLVLYSNHGMVGDVRDVHPNTTGVNGGIDLGKNIELGLLALPDSEEVLVIVDPADASPELFRTIQHEAAAFTNCRIKLVNGGKFSFAELLFLCERLPEKSFVVLGFYRDYRRDGFPNMVDFARQFFVQSSRPCLVPTSLSLTAGSLGGSTSKGTNNGMTLAEMVVHAVKNGRVEKVRIAKEHTNFVIDIAAAKRFDVNIGALPENVLLINKTASLWETNKAEIVLLGLMALTLSALLSCVVVLLSRNRQNATLSGLNDQLRQAVAEAENAAQAKTLFLATMSHEIRTPLNAVIGFSELLQTDHIPPQQQKEYLQAINLAGVSLLNLINDILDLSKIESNQMPIVPIKTDIHALCQEIALIFKHRLEEKGLALALRGSAHFPWVYVDAKRLRQIMLNLVGNAVKFTRRGGITIDYHFIPDNDNSGTFAIKIIDTGIGIGSESHQKIFEPFTQADAVPGTRAEENSTGLGLPIVKRLVHRMGGKITLRSEPGSGSSFCIELPHVAYAQKGPDDAPAADNESEPMVSAAQEAPSGKKLLLVDDVAMNLKVLAMMAKRLNCETTSATSAKQAIEALQKGLVPDIILTDIWMPDMDGVALARLIRATPGWEKYYIVAVSAGNAGTSEAADNVFDGFLQKPVSLASLKKIITEPRSAAAFSPTRA